MATDAESFVAFLDKYRDQNEQSIERMTAFGEQLQTLSLQHRDAIRDLERERVAGRHAQADAEEWERRFKTLEESVNRGAFVLVLVDADADEYLFDDKYYLGDPTEGGERAAVDLMAAAREYVQSVDSGLGDVPIVTKAFASGDGLAHLLSKSGGAMPRDFLSYLLRFTSGFSQAGDLCDFVLVGKGKDRADHKILGALRQAMENPCCRHIVLAACHDNGYVRTLEKYVHNPTLKEKVTLLKSFQTGHEFASLPFAFITMKSIFRTRPVAPLAFPPGLSNGNEVGSSILLATSGPSMNSSPSTIASPAVPASATVLPQQQLPTRTYATLAATQPVPLFGTIGTDAILLNDTAHRLDCRLPALSEREANKFHRKVYIEGKRFCNAYQVGSGCAGGCGYFHDPLTPAEKLVMRHRLREQSCKDGGDCRRPKCFYGHHCCCSRTKKCAFPAEMHDVSVSIWSVVATS